LFHYAWLWGGEVLVGLAALAYAVAVVPARRPR
jgi:hypothetical protein